MYGASVHRALFLEDKTKLLLHEQAYSKCINGALHDTYARHAVPWLYSRLANAENQRIGLHANVRFLNVVTKK